MSFSSKFSCMKEWPSYKRSVSFKRAQTWRLSSFTCLSLSSSHFVLLESAAIVGAIFPLTTCSQVPGAVFFNLLLNGLLVSHSFNFKFSFWRRISVCLFFMSNTSFWRCIPSDGDVWNCSNFAVFVSCTIWFKNSKSVVLLCYFFPNCCTWWKISAPNLSKSEIWLDSFLYFLRLGVLILHNTGVFIVSWRP